MCTYKSQIDKALGSEPTRCKTYSLRNYHKLPQVQLLSEEQREAIEVVGRVLPFKTNNYVVENLIDWDSVPDDPVFILNFPQKGMLLPHHYDEVRAVLKSGASDEEIRATANRIRLELNPHPAGQVEHNVPTLDGVQLQGIQHKYDQTVLFFPSQGQTCHAYCTFCFRWPLFTRMPGMRFGINEVKPLIRYVRRHLEVSDILITGGDPLTMTAKLLSSYIDPILDAELPNLDTIRIGTKALTYWPYRFLTDSDSDDLLRLFERVTTKGKHLAFMAHWNHPREMEPLPVQKAVARIRDAGAEIRTQAPLLAHINDDPAIWSELWKEQVKLGCVPYYMFLARDTGATHYFGVPLVKAWEIFRGAYQGVSGIARTVRGPIMSATPGKVQVLGVRTIKRQKVIVLRFLQGREPDWVMRPFFAEYDDQAVWVDELKPAFGNQKFFFE
jgi:KamA family protein